MQKFRNKYYNTQNWWYDNFKSVNYTTFKTRWLPSNLSDLKMAALSPPPPSPSLSREQSRGNTSQTHFPENDTSVERDMFLIKLFYSFLEYLSIWKWLLQSDI